MPKIKYVSRKFSPGILALIDQANAIITAFTAQGYKLTLRQLYYQFVGKALIENTVQSYKRLGSAINDARLAGLIDWNAIEDRTRETQSVNTWSEPGDIVEACAQQFKIDLWENQEFRPEVWIEKEALAGVFERVCREMRVSYLSCRGYTSQSEMWSSAQRINDILSTGQKMVILHFGDHDPSGIDMSRDIRDRLKLLGAEASGDEFEFRRLALNMDQVKKHRLPPNPAKATDARFESYQNEFGSESWELDALNPSMLSDMARKEIESLIDFTRWEQKQEEEEKYREQLKYVSKNFSEISKRMDEDFERQKRREK